MKILSKKVKLGKSRASITKAAQAVPRILSDKKAKTNPNEIAKNQADDSVMYCGTRIQKAAIMAEVIGKAIPKLTQKGYLLVRGDKPGTLLREVMHDASGDFYMTVDGKKYGSVSALSEKNLKATILSTVGLLALAKKVDHCVEATQETTKKKHIVWLLNDNGDQYVAGVGVEGGKLVVFNMESPHPWNRPNPEVRFGNYKDAEENFAKFFAKV